MRGMESNINSNTDALDVTNEIDSITNNNTQLPPPVTPPQTPVFVHEEGPSKKEIEADLIILQKRFRRAAGYALKIDKNFNSIQNYVNDLTVESDSFLRDTSTFRDQILSAQATRGNEHAISILKDHLERARGVMRQVESVKNSIKSSVQTGQSIVEALREEVTEDD